MIAPLAMVLLASGAGTVSAEPQKNQILVPATCDNGQSYTFAINGMSKVGQIVGSNGNIVIRSFTVAYFDLDGNPVGGDSFGQGNKKDLQKDPITCNGSVTTELQGLGVVKAVFDFRGFLTPEASSTY